MTSEHDKKILCPCRSGKLYEVCCRPFHLGKKPDTALQLMRSRYAAYALGIPDYIIHATHPASPQFCHDTEEWAQKITEFSSHTEFKDLKILGVQEGGSFATVTFIAHLVQDKKDVSFTEKSYFEKVKGKWLYRSGHLSQGHAPNLMTTGQLRLLPLAYYGDPILRKVADPIQNVTDDVRKLVEEMIETMDACDGIGLAAPQVHHSIKLFIIRKPIEVEAGKIEFREVKVFINPTLSLPSAETWKESEGCLSIPTIHADVERPREITIEYTNLAGHVIKERVSGWEARVIMHENDHINGILFIDHLDKETSKSLEPFLQHLYNKIHDGTEL
ncbi:MAG TPA: peptide deformylase [Chlamydiales bacterium]|nr:peptide deformylase [Chlamydiales bacterium]